MTKETATALARREWGPSAFVRRHESGSYSGRRFVRYEVGTSESIGNTRILGMSGQSWEDAFGMAGVRLDMRDPLFEREAFARRAAAHEPTAVQYLLPMAQG